MSVPPVPDISPYFHIHKDIGTGGTGKMGYNPIREDKKKCNFIFSYMGWLRPFHVFHLCHLSNHLKLNINTRHRLGTGKRHPCHKKRRGSAPPFDFLGRSCNQAEVRPAARY